MLENIKLIDLMFGRIVKTVLKLILKFLQQNAEHIYFEFSMSYNYNGSLIQIAHPVQSISVNKSNVIFADKTGLKNTRFATNSDARVFVNWLKSN